MSDFLGRMAGRARNTLRVAQPLIPSAFAPGAPAAEAGFEAGEAERAPAQTVPQPLALARQRTEGAREIPPPEEVAPAFKDARFRDRLSESPEIAGGQGENEIPPAAPGQQRIRTTEGDPPRALDWSEQATATLPLPAQAKRAIPTSTAAPVAGPVPARQRAAAAESPAPVIRVTIGRVDVRAEFPPSTSRPEVRKTEPARLSLDEYMKQRSEGKR